MLFDAIGAFLRGIRDRGFAGLSPRSGTAEAKAGVRRIDALFETFLGGGLWDPTHATKDVAWMGHAILTVSVRIEISML